MCVGLVGGRGGGVDLGSFSSSFLSFIASMLYIRFSCRSAGAKDAGWRVQSSVELCSSPQVYPGQVPIHHNVDSHTHKLYVHIRLWENSKHVARQLEKIGEFTKQKPLSLVRMSF